MKDFLALMNPTRWAILGGVLLALVLAAGAGMLKVHSSGVGMGKAEVQALWDKDSLERSHERNRTLIAHTERLISLSEELNGARDAYQQTLTDLASSRDAARTRGERVRVAAKGTGLDASLANAQCPVVRTFAAGAFRTAQACRDDLAEIGLGAGGLVDVSAVAKYERARADNLLKFSLPRSPSLTKDLK
jgi:hypothetical protein